MKSNIIVTILFLLGIGFSGCTKDNSSSGTNDIVPPTEDSSTNGSIGGLDTPIDNLIDTNLSIDNPSDDYSNESSHAYVIDLDVEVTGDLEISDDIDFFKFTLRQQTTVEFDKSSRSGNVGNSDTFYFDVFDDSNNNLLHVYTSNSDKHSLTLGAGTYYIRVKTFDDDITGYRFILNS